MRTQMVSFSVRVESGAAQRLLKMSDSTRRTISQLVGFCIERSLDDLQADVAAKVSGNLLGVRGVKRKGNPA